MESIETSNSVKAIDQKIFIVQTTAPVIKKEANNPYYSSKYAEYPEIQAKVKPILKENNLLVMFLPISGNRLTLFVKDTISSEFYKVTSDLNTINITPQAQGSAITYLKRYMLTAFFDLQIEDGMDDDGNAGSNAKPKGQQAQSQAAPAAAGGKKEPNPDRAWINPNSKLWFDAKIWFLTDPKADMKKLNFKYRISAKNQEIMAKQEVLKPGDKYWPFATAYLSKFATPEGVAAIVKAFDINESDLSDLQIDATNYTEPITQAPTETK